MRKKFYKFMKAMGIVIPHSLCYDCKREGHCIGTLPKLRQCYMFQPKEEEKNG